MNRIIIKSNIWLDAATNPPALLYRELENIIYAATNSADMDTFMAVISDREFMHFEVKVWSAFRAVEILAKDHRSGWPIVMKIQED
jgi:hypothetical protein